VTKGFPFGKSSAPLWIAAGNPCRTRKQKERDRFLMAIYGYVRCSTDDQTIMQQMDALRAAKCDRIFKDKFIRATAKNRPALLAVRKALKPGDTFMVTAIDRAFRSTAEAIAFLDDVMGDSVTFRSLAQSIDTRTPEGRKWYIDSANQAEYERAVISRRTREQMAAAKRRGKKFGRPKKLTPKKVLWARKALTGKKARSPSHVAKQLKVSLRTLNRALAENPAKTRSSRRSYS
jgi:DNA invertase Pin-like site-specific DNA recombinase